MGCAKPSPYITRHTWTNAYIANKRKKAQKQDPTAIETS